MIRSNYYSFDIVTCINWSGSKFIRGNVYRLNTMGYVIASASSSSAYPVSKYKDEFRKAYKNEQKRLYEKKTHNPW